MCVDLVQAVLYCWPDSGLDAPVAHLIPRPLLQIQSESGLGMGPRSAATGAISLTCLVHVYTHVLRGL